MAILSHLWIPEVVTNLRACEFIDFPRSRVDCRAGHTVMFRYKLLSAVCKSLIYRPTEEEFLTVAKTEVNV